MNTAEIKQKFRTSGRKHGCTAVFWKPIVRSKFETQNERTMSFPTPSPPTKPPQTLSADFNDWDSGNTSAGPSAGRRRDRYERQRVRSVSPHPSNDANNATAQINNTEKPPDALSEEAKIAVPIPENAVDVKDAIPLKNGSDSFASYSSHKSTQSNLSANKKDLPKESAEAHRVKMTQVGIHRQGDRSVGGFEESEKSLVWGEENGTFTLLSLFSGVKLD